MDFATDLRRSSVMLSMSILSNGIESVIYLVGSVIVKGCMQRPSAVAFYQQGSQAVHQTLVPFSVVTIRFLFALTNRRRKR